MNRSSNVHGGVRKGAGRPRVGNIRVAIRLTDEQTAWLDEQRKENDVTRSEFIRSLIENARVTQSPNNLVSEGNLSEDDLERTRQRAAMLEKFKEILSADWEEEDLSQEEMDAVRLAREARKRLAERRAES